MKKYLALGIALLMLLNTGAFAKGNRACPNCGKESDGNYCPYDGTKMPEATWICPRCGRENDSNYCPSDGTPNPATDLPQRAAYPVMMADENTFRYYEDYCKMPVFGNANVLRDMVIRLVFEKDASGMSGSAWDISEAKDRSVLADYREHTLHIAAAQGGPIAFPENCAKLFAGYSNLYRITFNGMADTSGVTDMSSMFSYCPSLTGIDLSGFDTRNVTDMENMFGNCRNLKSIDLSKWNTGSVQNMAGMFTACENLKALDLSGWSTANVTAMNHMFYRCARLENLDVSGFKTEKVTDMSYMFDGCGVTELDLSGWNTGNVTDMGSMFEGCESLTKLDVSGFRTSKVTSMRSMFSGCSNLESLDIRSFDMSNVTESNEMLSEVPNVVR